MKKQTKTVAALAKAVKSYNQRIDRAVKSGRLPADVAPPRASVKTIKGMTVGMSPQQAGQVLAAWTRELQKIHDKNALSMVKTEGGLTVTEYEVGRVKRMTKRYKKQVKATRERAEKARAEIPEIGGVKTAEGRAWSDKVETPQPLAKPGTAKGRERSRSALDVLEAIAMGGAWEQYKKNLIKAVKENFSGDDAKRVIEKIRKIPAGTIGNVFESKGESWADIHYWYDIKQMENWLASLENAIDEMSAY